MERRTFIHTAAWLSLAVVAPTQAKGCQQRKLDSIGLQLYTIRDAMQRDADEALRKVAKIGYKYVEGASYLDGKFYGQSPKSFKALLEKHGLQMPSGHVSVAAFRDEPERLLATAKQVGQEWVVMPWLPEDMRNAAGYTETIKLLNQVGELSKNYGIKVAYHNHDFEFLPLRGEAQLPIDRILAETDPETVYLELDLYWITKVGKSYASYFQAHPGRFPLWHIKDMDATPAKDFAPVGQGIIAWPPVFDAAQTAGMQYFFVEQDRTSGIVTPFDSVADSFAYLRKMRY